MNLCTCVSEERGNGESAGSEALSLLSHTLRYVSLADLGRLCPVWVATTFSSRGGKTQKKTIFFSIAVWPTNNDFENALSIESMGS